VPLAVHSVRTSRVRSPVTIEGAAATAAWPAAESTTASPPFVSTMSRSPGAVLGFALGPESQAPSTAPAPESPAS